MKQKRENLVAGRLDVGTGDSGEDQGVLSRPQSAYGYERLGLTNDAADAGTATLGEPSSRPFVAVESSQHPPKPALDGSRQWNREDPWLWRPDVRREREPPPEQRPPRAARHSINLLSRYKSKAIMAAGGVLVAGILAWVLVAWSMATSSPISPQTATAEPQAPAQQQTRSEPPAPPKEPAVSPAQAEQPKVNVWEILSPRDQEPAGSAASFAPSAQSPSAAGQAVLIQRPRYRDCPPGFVLNGIIKAPSGLMANINGKFVAVGGMVQDARVIEIRAYSVEMELFGERFLLGMGGRRGAASQPAPEQPEQPSPEQPQAEQAEQD